MDSSDADFIPSERGWSHTLADGVVTRLRFRNTPSGFVPEWMLAVRDVEVLSHLDITKAAERLFEDMSKEAHRLLEPSKGCEGAVLEL